jgi:hypothetical protein
MYTEKYASGTECGVSPYREKYDSGNIRTKEKKLTKKQGKMKGNRSKRITNLQKGENKVKRLSHGV